MSSDEDLGLQLKGLKITKKVGVEQADESVRHDSNDEDSVGYIDYRIGDGNESGSGDEDEYSHSNSGGSSAEDGNFGYMALNNDIMGTSSDEEGSDVSDVSDAPSDPEIGELYDQDQSKDDDQVGNPFRDPSNAQSVVSVVDEGELKTSGTHADKDLTSSTHVNGGNVKSSRGTDTDSDSSDDDGEWQTMPAVASYNIYNKSGDIELAPMIQSTESFVSNHDRSGKGGKQKTFEYTKMAGEQQAQRSYITNTKTDFLFNHKKLKNLNNSTTSIRSSTVSLDETRDDEYDEFEDGVDPVDDLNPESQLNVTKLLLDDMEKFAYAAAVNVLANQMSTDLATLCLCVDIKAHKKLAKRLQFTQRDMAAWKTVTLQRLYDHLEISEQEITMLDKLSIHKIKLEDLCKCLKTTQNIENPFEHEVKDNSKEQGTSDEEKDPKSEDNVTSTNTETQDLSVLKKNDNTSSTENGSENDQSSDIEKDDYDRTLNEESESDRISQKGIDDVTQNSISLPETSHIAPTNVINPENLKDKQRLNVDVAWTIICDLFLILLQNSTYDSRSRTLLIKFADALNITKLEVCEFEKRVTDSLDLEQSTDDQVWDEQDLMKDRRKKRKRRKLAYVGLAMVGGSLVLGLSGGLLAPVIGAGIAAGLSTIGVTGATGFLTGVGGTTIVALSSTAIGANIGARGMSKRMGSVRTFEFLPLHNNRRVNLIINVSGWMVGNDDDVRLPFSTVDPVEGDLFSLYWEPEMLKSMGQTIGIVASEVFTQTLQQVLGATILTGLMSAIQLPMALSKLGYILDNPWNVSLDRAWSAGLILADTLIGRNLGERPVTLIGFSLGARVILSCLIELCRKNGLGLVENVFIFGTPVVSKKEELVMARSVVNGRFVNGYSDIDWLLAYLFRATAGGFRSIMGISPIEGIEGIENFNCTEFVDGHLSYRSNMPKLLKKLGIAVLSEEFAEIEETVDPDEFKRKRKLINDVDAAQKKLNQNKKSNSWVPKWLQPKKSQWQTMVEEAVEEGIDVSNPSNSEPKIRKKKDAALVDHGALMHELEVLKLAMRKEQEKKDLEKDSNNVELSASNDGSVKSENHSPESNTDVNSSHQLEQPKVKDNMATPQTPNSFQLLSAGRTILPEDDEINTKKSKDVEYYFPDDI
ncbi:Mil1p RNJ42_05165 [Nakaseomyces bracarensis]|uniref:Mil1p n=1 Tax=Nakaseomyces bracarensis TaxID=273131 RepID=UPI0038728F9C